VDSRLGERGAGGLKLFQTTPTQQSVGRSGLEKFEGWDGGWGWMEIMDFGYGGMGGGWGLGTKGMKKNKQDRDGG
jgi:hypothetical protein